MTGQENDETEDRFLRDALAELDELRGHVDRLARAVAVHLERRLAVRGHQAGTVRPIRPEGGNDGG